MSKSVWLRAGIIVTTMWFSATVSFTIFEVMNTPPDACCYNVSHLKMLRCEADLTRAPATVWDKAADAKGAPRWAAQVVQPGFQLLPPDRRTAVFDQYWTTVVAPALPAADRPGLLEKFIAADSDCRFAIKTSLKLRTFLGVLLGVPLLGWGVSYALLRGRLGKTSGKRAAAPARASDAMTLGEDD